MELYLFSTPLWETGLGEKEGAITALYLPGRPVPRLISRPTPLLEEGRRQLLEYLAGERQIFDLPLAPAGTPFQRAVWQALQTIPYGQTRSYGDIARQIGRPKAFRAVGMANHENPIPIFIPCHRVVGSDGSLTGYAGGLELKKALLGLEGSFN
jgi:methylated-DNA-[protein]-cysteine S-methyltransferase